MVAPWRIELHQPGLRVLLVRLHEFIAQLVDTISGHLGETSGHHEGQCPGQDLVLHLAELSLNKAAKKPEKNPKITLFAQSPFLHRSLWEDGAALNLVANFNP